MNSKADLSLESFSPIRLEDRSLFERYFLECDPPSCEYNFPNLFCWGEAYKASWRIYKKRLLIYYGLDDDLLFPLGNPMPDARELCELSDAFRKEGKSGSINQPPDGFLEASPEVLEHFEPVLDEDAGEYIYLSEKLVELNGSALAKKKNLIAQFLRNNPDAHCVPLTAKLSDACLQLSEKWRGTRTEAVEYLDQEKSALERAMRNYEALGMTGLSAFSKDKLVAFAACSRINSKTCTVHFEKYDPEFKGAAQFINRELAKSVRETFVFINREQDLGIPGLRQAKRSYEPFSIRPHMTLRRKI